ncbi:transposase [Bernardetia litoralis DSM 6794]|uniref:Transposase n=1 Tax=Bernardetia litoralis (strain ATCC 23117 / DSM 6794 / NBRC 15988 / NCIMB 1366 / Fx l1 / Sio-4) TaxID=880071 RepID=I4ANR4_BERLS|nr:transposase [Bernardetia litoralis]AFM05599.1 transposase [Bernardetia litoralis DSM 6794]
MQQRNLPHIYPEGATFFINFCLHNVIPQKIADKIKNEYDVSINEVVQKKLSKNEQEDSLYKLRKKYFATYDKTLELYAKEDDYLKNPKVVKIIMDRMKEYDGKKYDLLSYCVMSNHVHLLFCTADYEKIDMSHIMKLIKGGSAHSINQVLKRKGIFWQKESYDHYVRNDKEFKNIIYYILENPVRVGVVEKWDSYPFTYLKSDEID